MGFFSILIRVDFLCQKTRFFCSKTPPHFRVEKEGRKRCKKGVRNRPPFRGRYAVVKSDKIVTQATVLNKNGPPLEKKNLSVGRRKKNIFSKKKNL